MNEKEVLPKVFVREVLDHKVLFCQNTIQKRLREIGTQITEDFKREELVCVCVLKGAFVFMADLIRHIDLPLSVEFIGVSSYQGTKSTGHVRLTHDLAADVSGKNVLLIEDVIDSGVTIDYLLNTLLVREPKTLKVAAFLNKPASNRMTHKIDYVGFEITKEFVIGYGLDLDQRYRNLPYVGQVMES
jgi:hypoxanthine phosphoribosyltransferase